MHRESQVAPVDEHSAGREATGSHPTEGALRAATWSLAALVAVAPLVIGGVRPDHQLLLGFGALAVFTLTAWTRFGHRLRFRWPLWPPAILCVLGLGQLVPLPAGVVEAIAPRAHEIFSFTLGDLGLYGPGTGHALSVDPPSTLLAVVHQAAFLAVAWAASELPRGHRRTVSLAILGSATLVAVIGFVHLAFGADRILGFYVPVNGAPLRGYYGTFVNNNTLASFLALGAMLGLGHAAESDDASIRGRVLVATALCAAGNLLSGSRGGQVALVMGLLAFVALSHVPGPEAQDAQRARSRVLARAGLAAGSIGLGLALFLLPDWQRTGWDALVTENKFAAWPAALDYAAAFPALGSGRGTFGVTYPLFQSLTMPSQVSHPENIILQHLCEWGLVGALVGLGGAVLGFGAALRAPGRATQPRHWGLLAGLVAVGIGQLADFGLEAAGLSLPVAAAFGLTLTRLRRERAPRRGRRLAPVAALGATAFLGFVAWRAPMALAALPDRAIGTVAAAPPEASAILSAAQASVADHPADAFLALKVAQRLEALPEPDFASVMRWLNRALFLAPNAGEIRLLAARALSRRGRWTQAADEYRAAMETLPWETLRLVREIVARVRTPELWARAIADTDTARLALGNALLAGAPPPLARETIQRLQVDRPNDAGLWTLSARACLGVDDRACVAEAAARLDALGRPLVAAPFRARLALRAGQPAEARGHLEAVRALGTRDRDFLSAAARLYRDLDDLAAGRETLDRLWPLVALDDRQAAAFLAERGALELELGDPALAVQNYERAWRLRPAPAYARGLTAAADRLGRPELARSVLGPTASGAGGSPTGSSDGPAPSPDARPALPD
jgi:tetratricopeptide (TPR) repeat protein